MRNENRRISLDLERMVLDIKPPIHISVLICCTQIKWKYQSGS